jgi:release factor glutamine methyltransferase
MKVHDAVCEATKRLRAAGVDAPRRDARLLLAEALGVSHPALLDPRCPVSDSDWARFVDNLVRREAREPISRIRGTREFWGLEFALSQATLDPRPDTETLVEAVLETFAKYAPPRRILDLGTGSGCILCALLHAWREATGVGVDVSADALATARANAERLGLAGRATFVAGNWTDGIDELFDLVVSNPPYICSGDIASLPPEVRAFDPTFALDGGADGLDAVRAIARGLPHVLDSDGIVAVEIGAGQAAEVTRIFAAADLDVRDVRDDVSCIPRVVVARHGRV